MIEEIKVGGRLYQSRTVNNVPRQWFCGFVRVDEETWAILTALAASRAETEDWKANAQRENAALVQAQQRIAELEQEREDVRRVEAWPASVREKFSITDETQNVCTHGTGYAETERKHYWNGYADAVDDAERAIRAALGRMLKEGA